MPRKLFSSKENIYTYVGKANANLANIRFFDFYWGFSLTISYPGLEFFFRAVNTNVIINNHKFLK